MNSVSPIETHHCSSRQSQHGAVWLALLLALATSLAALLLITHGHDGAPTDRHRDTARALSQARAALIGDAALTPAPDAAGFLRLPDIGIGVGNAPAEGSGAPNFSGNAKDYSVLGKLPWRTLKLEPLRDGHHECLWYAVSGRFKITPQTDALNWDTPGQLTLVDVHGNTLVERAAALLIAPGQILPEQNRVLADPAYAQCAGNYDAKNYLDAEDASGGTNYFSGSINNRVAASTADKIFISARHERRNDAFLALTTDDIFRPLMRRADFSRQISALLDDAYFQTVAITGSKGTGSVACNQLASANQAFCKNWKEMLLLTQLPQPAPVMLDGALTQDCARALMFGGYKNTTQSRATAADKSAPANYLEDGNLAAFAAPVAIGAQFNGHSTFDPGRPDADLLRCLP